MPRGQVRRNSVAGSARKPAAKHSAPEPITALDAVKPMPARAVEARRERRRRDDGDQDRMARLKLAIPKEIQEQADREGKVLRWVLDEPGRLQQMHADDWDIVENCHSVAAGKETETQLRLCSKYKDWYDSDQRDQAEMLNKREQSLIRGEKIDPNDKRQAATSYVPEGNRISR